SIMPPWPRLELTGPVPELEIHDHGIDVHEHGSLGARKRTVRIPDRQVAEAALGIIEQLCSRRRNQRTRPERLPHRSSPTPPGTRESIEPADAMSSTKH